MKTALVTGASRGIGREIAFRLAKEGYAVILHYNRNESRARELTDEIHGLKVPVLAVKADFAIPGDIQKMFKTIFTQFSGIDVLVNNAAVAEQKLFTDLTESDWQRMFDINVKSAFLCAKESIPSMIRKQHGRIINLSSIWGVAGASCEVHYSASKAALIGFTKALAKELGPSGITVNCVAPGVIDTDMNRQLPAETLSALAQEAPLGRLGTPEDVAHTVLFLASEQAGFITGQVISPNGGIVI